MCIYPQGSQVAVGTNKGYVQIWDVSVSKKLHTLTGHGARVGKFLHLEDTVLQLTAPVILGD